MDIEKNRSNWNARAERYARLRHSEKILRPILDEPSRAFHRTTWQIICRYFPDLHGKRVCVPSSGDNHAVFAFALLGAHVTSCDISEKQLYYARQIAHREGFSDAIDFVRTDTMTLDGISDAAYDLVYTSNGVHVWLGDLASMYRNVYRVLKSGGMNILYEIHPFTRPFDDDLKLIKPYDMTGPFEDETTVNYHWRMQDILNAVIEAGLQPTQLEEMFAEKDYDQPFWLPMDDAINGVTVSPEEVDRMYDWQQNPSMGIPAWMCIANRKN